MARSFWSVPSKLAKARRRRTDKAHKEEELAGRLVTILDPSSATSEAYRTLRTNLLYTYTLVDDPPKVIVLTSPGQGEGKSITCANLGVVLAQANKNTLIIDCNLRKPVIHKFFGLRNLRGIVDVLAGEHKLQEVWTEPVPGLKVVPAGTIPPNPVEFLGSQRLSKFFASVREEFDYVLVDTPPVGVVSDPAVVATQGDGALLILDAQNTRKGALRRSARSLEVVGANILGTVMNNVRPSSEGYYHYQYGYTDN